MKLLLKFTDEFGVKTSNFFILFIFLIFISACNKPIQQPETLDRVFLDLEKAIRDYDKLKKDKQKELVAVEERVKLAPPRSSEQKKAKDEYFKIKNELFLLDQKILYAQLRRHSRQVQNRKEYMDAWRKGEEWDTNKSFDMYKLERKLANAPKEWKNEADLKKLESKKPKKKDKKDPEHK